MSDGSVSRPGKGKGIMGFFFRSSKSSSSQSGSSHKPHPEGDAQQKPGSPGKGTIFSKAFGRTRRTARKRVPQNFERITFVRPKNLPLETPPTSEEEEEELEGEPFPSEGHNNEGTHHQGVEEVEGENEVPAHEESPPLAPGRRQDSPLPRFDQVDRESSPDESAPMDSEGYEQVDLTGQATQRPRSPYPRGDYLSYLRHSSSTHYHAAMFGANPPPYPTIALGPYSTVYGSPSPTFIPPPYPNPYTYPAMPPPLSHNDPYAQFPCYGSPSGYGYLNPAYPSPSDQRRDSMLEMLLQQTSTLVGMAGDVIPSGEPSRRSREEPYRRRSQPQLRRTASARRNVARDPRRG